MEVIDEPLQGEQGAHASVWVDAGPSVPSPHMTVADVSTSSQSGEVKVDPVGFVGRANFAAVSEK